MDLNAMIEQAREEYQQVDYNLAAAEGRRAQMLEEYETTALVMTTRKHQLEGRMAALLDVQKEQADEVARLAESYRATKDQAESALQQLERDAAAVLQGIVDNNPPEASLSMLNGIQQKLAEQESNIPADA